MGLGCRSSEACLSISTGQRANTGSNLPADSKRRHGETDIPLVSLNTVFCQQRCLCVWVGVLRRRNQGTVGVLGSETV